MRPFLQRAGMRQQAGMLKQLALLQAIETGHCIQLEQQLSKASQSFLLILSSYSSGRTRAKSAYALLLWFTRLC